MPSNGPIKRIISSNLFLTHSNELIFCHYHKISLTHVKQAEKLASLGGVEAYLVLTEDGKLYYFELNRPESYVAVLSPTFEDGLTDSEKSKAYTTYAKKCFSESMKTLIQIAQLPSVDEIIPGSVVHVVSGTDVYRLIPSAHLINGKNNIVRLEKINIAGVIQIISGVYNGPHTYSFYRTEDGAVYAYGDNAWGQLGLKGIAVAATPTKLLGLPPVKEIILVDTLTLYVTVDGELYVSGTDDEDNLFPKLPDAVKIKGRNAWVPDKDKWSTPTKVPNICGIDSLRIVGNKIYLLTPKGTVEARWGETLFNKIPKRIIPTHHSGTFVLTSEGDAQVISSESDSSFLSIELSDIKDMIVVDEYQNRFIYFLTNSGKVLSLNLDTAHVANKQPVEILEGISSMVQIDDQIFFLGSKAYSIWRNEVYSLPEQWQDKSSKDEKVPGVTAAGFFTNPKFNNLERLKQKYHLKDDSQASLSKGLRKAARRGKVNHVLLFTRCVDDLNARNHKDKSALDYAERYGEKHQNHGCASVLKNCGAQFKPK